MTHITLPRETVHQALDAFNHQPYVMNKDVCEALENLRAALQQTEPQAPIVGLQNVHDAIMADPSLADTAPQAQAGEIEVVAWRTKVHRMNGNEYWAYTERSLFLSLPEPSEPSEPLITLQSHREAVESLGRANDTLFVQGQKLYETIAKKDAALKACVEALFSATPDNGDQWQNAITQAQGELK